MTLVNETGQKMAYWIQSARGGANCGEIDVGGLVDCPSYDDDTDVYVGFKPVGGQTAFAINCAQTATGEQVQIELTVQGAA